ncbi:serine hydrolase domain-containing protein [Dokdonia sp. Hel_I_53]|uniref:serine hydrolase domain-containing protein n=1 Tax=Dokdonia sp. Hel_I_53 TaxID=1566287 RepID=UPI00119B1E21|nr:serine hydrolase [Dokdonia sp. Hel_I_53]TVZ51943.1 CubicO group peptidase (beta-lactamase class C family) [Dokdonia sp. Hel_I_53]
MRFLIIPILLFFSCTTTDNLDDVASDEDSASLYFPPIDDTSWETASLDTLEWNETALEELNSFLIASNTKAFIILKNGKIVVENYYQNTDSNTNHRWNSAAKTLTAATVGIAQEQGFLHIENPSSDYLGEGWTSMTTEQEAAITLKNQLTMTTGGEYMVDNLNCTDPECLSYNSEAGASWYYHNAFYILIQDVISNATAQSFDTYFNTQLQAKIGMNGFWFDFGYLKLFSSNARDMARFGLLNLSNGIWNSEQIIPASFFTEMTTISQSLNKAYGYLWWLNGQSDYKLPGSNITFSGKLIPTAPDDLIAGLGKDDQKLYVVPSEKLVVIRLGDATDSSTQGPSGYDTELWAKIMAVID